jgi:hypothetical protein
MTHDQAFIGFSYHIWISVYWSVVERRSGQKEECNKACKYWGLSFTEFCKDVRQPYSAQYVVRANLGKFGLNKAFRNFPTNTTAQKFWHSFIFYMRDMFWQTNPAVARYGLHQGNIKLSTQNGAWISIRIIICIILCIIMCITVCIILPAYFSIRHVQWKHKLLIIWK